MDTETLMFDFSGFYDRIAAESQHVIRFAEVGVADGISALYLAQKLKEHNRSFTLYMVDNMDYGRYIQMKTIYKNIIKSGLGEFIEVIPKSSLEAAKDFNDGFLDFVFLDSSHEYGMTKQEIVAWYPKIIDGSILAGHDYFSEENKGVRKAVDELIPETITRNDIEDRIFEPEQFLHTEQTSMGNGVWWVKKDFYKKLNQC